MTTRLYRSRTDKKIFGVCGGLGQSLSVDPTLLRFVVVVATIFSGGTAGLLYLVAGFVIPEEPPGLGQGDTFGYGTQQSYAGGTTQGSCWNWGSSFNKHKKSHRPMHNGSADPHHGGAFAAGASGHTMNGGMGSGTHMSSTKDSAAYGHTDYRASASYASEQQTAADLDALMREVEAKALRQEIEELKRRLAKYENREKNGDMGVTEVSSEQPSTDNQNIQENK